MRCLFGSFIETPFTGHPPSLLRHLGYHFPRSGYNRLDRPPAFRQCRGVLRLPRAFPLLCLDRVADQPRSHPENSRRSKRFSTTEPGVLKYPEQLPTLKSSGKAVVHPLAVETFACCRLDSSDGDLTGHHCLNHREEIGKQFCHFLLWRLARKVPNHCGHFTLNLAQMSFARASKQRAS
jgi:hypothetical protein